MMALVAFVAGLACGLMLASALCARHLDNEIARNDRFEAELKRQREDLDALRRDMWPVQ